MHKVPTQNQMLNALRGSLTELKSEWRAAMINLVLSSISGLFCIGGSIRADNWNLYNVVICMTGAYLMFASHACTKHANMLSRKIHATEQTLDCIELANIEED